MSHEACGQFYNLEYRPLYEPHNYSLSTVFDSEAYRGRLIWQFLQKAGYGGIIGSGARVLEVGCGTGGILSVFRERGCYVRGVDLSEACAEHARSQDLDVRVGTWRTAAESDFRPDLILYSHVLEHLLDPISELREIRSLLASDGLLYCEVPGVRYLRRAGYDFLDTIQLAHLSYFTLDTLAAVLSVSGFTVRHGNEFIRCVAQPSENGSMLSCSDFPGVVTFLKKVEFERQFFPVPPFALLRRGRALIRKFTHFRH